MKDEAFHLVMLCACAIEAVGSELSVYAPGGVRSALQCAAAAFEHETHHTIKFMFGTGGGIQKQEWRQGRLEPYVV
jgi:accessory colonization factor AcfC